MNEQEVRARAKELIGKVGVTSLATVDEHGFPQSRAMMTAVVDDDFTTYYITGRPSAKCRQIAASPKASSLWTQVVDPMKDWQTVLVKGEARVTDDRALRERFWMEELRAFFPAGADDPNYVIIVIKPTELIYADAQANQPVVVKL